MTHLAAEAMLHAALPMTSIDGAICIVADAYAMLGATLEFAQIVAAVREHLDSVSPVL